MPRGVPKNGFRKTKKRMAAGLTLPLTVSKVMLAPSAPVVERTEDEIRKDLNERFGALSEMTHATVKGKNASMIVSGPAGVGKTFTIGEILSDNSKTVYSTVIKGYVRPTGLYKTLYEFRHPNCVVVFDDADSIFNDDVSLNLLKAACDTTKRRTLHWLTETKMEDEDGERMPRSFQFEGSIIFVTNYDFDDMIARGSKLSPHFEALISRSHYLDLGMKTTADYVVRIKQVVQEHKMLRDSGFSQTEEDSLLAFIDENKNRLRELSLRMVLKLASLMRINPTTWKTLARTTCMKGV
jgi:hypothetical protein